MRARSSAPCRFTRLSLLALLAVSACEENQGEPLAFDENTNLSALTQAASGFHFYPPLAEAPIFSGAFDDRALDAMSVEIQELDAVGGNVLRTVASFNRHSTPRLSLVAAHEVYFVNVRAADYLTNSSRTYRFRVLGAGRELGFSDLSDRVWGFLARYPELLIGVKIRVELSACATIAPDSVADNCDGVDNDCDGSIDEDMTACDDGNACTQTDTCQDGACTGTNDVICTAADDCHDAGTCDPATGLCSNPIKADGSPCMIGTETGECSAGTCVPRSTIHVFTNVMGSATYPIQNLGQIPAVPGKRVHIMRLGICGDADTYSGLQGFRAYDGSSIDFTWGAGQANQSGATYFLSPTLPTNGSGRGFSYREVNIYGALSAPVNIDFQFRNDWDAHYCDATDEFGTPYLDGYSTARAWLKYEYVDLEGSPCNDNNLCTQTDIWQNGICVGSNPVVCTASDQCHVPGVCSPSTGTCSNPIIANGTGCSDGNACTQTDTCQAGSCVGSNPITCTTNAECQVASCNPANGQCVNSSASDGTLCQISPGVVGACISSVCSEDLVFSAVSPASSTPVINLGSIPAVTNKRIHIVRIGICGDADSGSGLQGFRAYDNAGLSLTWGAGQANNPGVTHFLSPTPSTSSSGRGFSYRDLNLFSALGASLTVNFEYRYDWDGRYCDATDERGMRYTDAASTARAWIRYRYVDECAVDGQPCNDGNACTRSDSCQGGACVGSNPVVCTASDQCHDVGTCNTTTGVCSNPAKANGTWCNDGTLCTQSDSCEAGVCVGSDPVECFGSDQCHVGMCNASTGACYDANAPDRTACTLPGGGVNECLGGICAPAQYTFTAVTPAGSSPVINLGQIPARAGMRIYITRIGICGDADSGSGLQGFRAYGTGIDFTWGAGQANQSGAIHFLSPTPTTSGSGRGFSYMNVARYGSVGQPVNIDFQFRNDWDARYCYAADENGAFYSDAASTARAWVKYTYVP